MASTKLITWGEGLACDNRQPIISRLKRGPGARGADLYLDGATPSHWSYVRGIKIRCADVACEQTVEMVYYVYTAEKHAPTTQRICVAITDEPPDMRVPVIVDGKQDWYAHMATQPWKLFESSDAGRDALMAYTSDRRVCVVVELDIMKKTVMDVQYVLENVQDARMMFLEARFLDVFQNTLFCDGNDERIK